MNSDRHTVQQLPPGINIDRRRKRAKTYTAAAVWARGSLYVGIAVLTDLVATLGSDEPVNWPLQITKLTLAGLIAARAYVDQTPSQQEETTEG